MDTRTGQIWTPEEVEQLKEEMAKGNSDVGGKLQDLLIPMSIPPTKKQLSRKPPKVGRNEYCPCASGKKFKNCCLKI